MNISNHSTKREYHGRLGGAGFEYIWTNIRSKTKNPRGKQDPGEETFDPQIGAYGGGIGKERRILLEKPSQELNHFSIY